MFTLLNNIRNKIVDSNTFKTSVLLLGIDGCGKTTLKEAICQFANPARKPKMVIPTFGLNTELIKDGKVQVRIWDLSGKETFRSIWNDYLKEAESVIYIVNGKQNERIHESRKTYDDILCKFNRKIAIIFLNCDKNILDVFPSVDRANAFFFVDMKNSENIQKVYLWIKGNAKKD